MKFIKNANINFIGKRHIFFLVSLALILAGVFFLVFRGPNLGIDFKGGILLQISFDGAVDINKLRGVLLSTNLPGLELQSSENNNVIVRVKKTDIERDELANLIKTKINENFKEVSATVERTEFVGPTIGKHLVKQAFFAVLFSLLGIIIYVAFRFHSSLWGVAGVIALAHDVFIVIGIFAALNIEISLTVIAAILTLAGYSINDTIVIFDRIRENNRLFSKDEFKKVINLSINQTLSRTIITSFTTFIVVASLYLFGGQVIKDFAFALLIGILAGTYSSIYIASPLVYEWEVYRRRRDSKLR